MQYLNYTSSRVEVGIYYLPYQFHLNSFFYLKEQEFPDSRFRFSRTKFESASHTKTFKSKALDFSRKVFQEVLDAEYDFKRLNAHLLTMTVPQPEQILQYQDHCSNFANGSWKTNDYGKEIDCGKDKKSFLPLSIRLWEIKEQMKNSDYNLDDDINLNESDPKTTGFYIPCSNYFSATAKGYVKDGKQIDAKESEDYNTNELTGIKGYKTGAAKPSSDDAYGLLDKRHFRDAPANNCETICPLPGFHLTHKGEQLIEIELDLTEEEGLRAAKVLGKRKYR